MNQTRIVTIVILASVLLAIEVTAQQRPVAYPLLKNRIEPEEFGIQDDTVTTISAMAFFPKALSEPLTQEYSWEVSPSFALYQRYPYPTYGNSHYFAGLDLPAGVVIDAIGLNSTSDADGVIGLALWQRDRYANVSPLASFSAPAHGWDTDYTYPGVQLGDHLDKEYVVEIEVGSDRQQFFAWVEVWWHRTVSPPPATATFLDVPTSHPFFQFIEAIAAAGITVGCGGGNFCPDQPITRKQEAAFIAKALGLHWPH